MAHQTSKFIAYYRCSTAKQGRSGLGLDAQMQAVQDYLNGGQWELVGEHTEVESGKRSDNRPELAKALAACRIHKATLLVAKLDRLARNAHFLLGLKDAGIEFICCDMPSANRLTVGVMAMVAEEEGRAVSIRTKQALAACKARGVVLGNPNNLTAEGRIRGAKEGNRVRSMKAKTLATDLLPVITALQDDGFTSLHGIANQLNIQGIPTTRGGKWQAIQVSRVLARMAV